MEILLQVLDELDDLHSMLRLKIGGILSLILALLAFIVTVAAFIWLSWFGLLMVGAAALGLLVRLLLRRRIRRARLAAHDAHAGG